jgi:hypothetical protein
MALMGTSVATMFVRAVKPVLLVRIVPVQGELFAAHLQGLVFEERIRVRKILWVS